MSCAKSRISDRALSHRSLFPGVVAGLGHAQPSTHEGDWERGLLHVDEAEHLHRTHRLRSPSWPKKTALFQQIPLHMQRAVLGLQSAQLLTIIGRQTIMAPTRTQIGLPQRVAQ